MTYTFPVMILREHLQVLRSLRRQMAYSPDLTPELQDEHEKQLSSEIAQTEAALRLMRANPLAEFDIMVLDASDDEIRLAWAYG